MARRKRRPSYRTAPKKNPTGNQQGILRGIRLPPSHRGHAQASHQVPTPCGPLSAQISSPGFHPISPLPPGPPGSGSGLGHLQASPDPEFIPGPHSPFAPLIPAGLGAREDWLGEGGSGSQGKELLCRDRDGIERRTRPGPGMSQRGKGRGGGHSGS